jgi:hypothetical protein
MALALRTMASGIAPCPVERSRDWIAALPRSHI